MKDTKIEWTDATWNPIRGCTRISPGCVNCYAERMAARFSKRGQWAHGFAKMTPSGPRWTGKLAGVPDHLEDPLRWKQPSRIFVNSMSDLFHEALPDGEIGDVFSVMESAKSLGHTFQILTKRADRMREWVTRFAKWLEHAGSEPFSTRFSHVWLGVSVEDQGTVEARIPDLLKTPAAVRFLSCEPLLQRIELRRHFWNADEHAINWVIVGGESGPDARPCRVDWVRTVVSHCGRAGVPVFVKQLGAHVIDRNDAGFEGDEPGAWPMDTTHDDWDKDPGRQYQGADTRILLASAKGGDPQEWPENLRVREFPKT